MSGEGQARTILVVDDEAQALRACSRVLRSAGYTQVETSSEPRSTALRVKEGDIGLLLLDLVMPGMRGEEVLGAVLQIRPDLPVVIVTAEADIRTAVTCIKRGATDYIVKPLQPEQLVSAVDQAFEQSALRYENERLRDSFFRRGLQNPEAFADILTQDPAMLRVFSYLEAICRGTHPLLIEGETGTGKELVARALHRVADPPGPFVAVNVAGLDDQMFSDALFGHASGAFTGAGGKRGGMVEQAGAGTLFLDEIGDLSEISQVKLLRLIQEREYYALGSDRPQRLRARVIAATQRAGALRQDLYFRLRAYRVEIPPLRDRLADLPLLVPHFLAQAARDLDLSPPTTPDELYLYLANYAFPGNVRELQAMIFDAVARHERGVMSIQPIVEMIRPEPTEPQRVGEAEIHWPYPLPALRDIDREAVHEALRRVAGNQSAAARMLGVSRPTIARYLRPPSNGSADSDETSPS